MMKGIFKVLVWNIALVVVGVVVIELAFGGWIIEDPFQKLHVPTSIDRQYDLDGLYPGRDSIQYTRDKHGLRGEYPSPSEIDILTIGGSTTDQAYISDGETWQDSMAESLRTAGYDLNVVNAGIDGQSTYGHLKSFEWWFPKIPQLSPKLIVYYVGINDVFTTQPPYLESSLAKDIYEKSIIYKVVRLVRGAMISRKYDIGHGRVDFSASDWTTVPAANEGIYDTVFGDTLAGYRARIRLLIERTKEMGAIPVFVTQETRLYRKSGETLEGVSVEFEYGGSRFNGVDRYYILEKFNEVLRTVCRDFGVLCIDLSSELQLTDSDFYDYMHNTPAGTKKVGSYIAEQLVQSRDSLGLAASDGN